MHHHTDRIAHTTAFVTPVVDHTLEREIARLAARVLLYAPSHRQDSTYHGLCYTSRGALAGKRNSSMGPPQEGSIRRPIERIFVLHLVSQLKISQDVFCLKNKVL